MVHSYGPQTLHYKRTVLTVRFYFQISENFYFDLNPDSMKKMLYLHVPSEDTSTISKAGIFSITYPSPDVFLVIRVSSFCVMCCKLLYYIPAKKHALYNPFPTQKYKILYHPTIVIFFSITILHVLPTSEA